MRAIEFLCIDLLRRELKEWTAPQYGLDDSIGVLRVMTWRFSYWMTATLLLGERYSLTKWTALTYWHSKIDNNDYEFHEFHELLFDCLDNGLRGLNE